MRATVARSAIAHTLALLLLATPISAENASPAVAPDARAVQELLHGAQGRREAWTSPPELVVLNSVMRYETGSMSDGYTATPELLTPDEVARLETDLTDALSVLTGGAFRAFTAIRHETVPAGRKVRVLRKGQIVVGRYEGVRAKANTIGYGGRTARGDGKITAAAIILDSDFDRGDGLRRLLRTHELGHALGLNHVESLVSVMNPRIGPEVTDFDRAAARMAFLAPEPSE